MAAGVASAQRYMHSPPVGVSPQHVLEPPLALMHICPPGQSSVNSQNVCMMGQHWCTQRLLPAVFLTQMHTLLPVCTQFLQQPAPRRGHSLWVAWASPAARPSPAAPSALAAAICSALRLEIALSASAAVRLSKS